MMCRHLGPAVLYCFRLLYSSLYCGDSPVWPCHRTPRPQPCFLAFLRTRRNSLTPLPVPRLEYKGVLWNEGVTGCELYEKTEGETMAVDTSACGGVGASSARAAGATATGPTEGPTAVGNATDAILNNLREHQYARVQYWRFFLNLGLALLDVAMFMVGAATVLLITGKAMNVALPPRSVFGPTWFLIIAGLLWAGCLRVVGIYHRHVMGDGYQMVPMVIKATAMQWVVLCAMSYVCDSVTLDLATLTVMVLAGAACTGVERVIARALMTRDFSKGAYTYATVVVGSPQGLADTLRFLQDRQQLNYRPVAICPIREDERSGEIEPAFLSDAELARLAEIPGCSDLSVLAYDDQLAERAVRLKAQTVMVADVLHRDSDNFNTFSLRVEALGLEIALMTSAADIGGHQLAMRTIHGVNILTISLTQYGLVARFAKRVFDIVVSLIAIVVSSPIMLAVAIAIKCDDGGPVLYRQERIGLRGRPFRIFKFRSMGLDADKHDADVAAASGQTLGARFKVKDDPRVTKVGRFIRKTSLDELPQFFNSLIGNMSVVGPRPQRQYEVDEYDPLYATRLLVKPGITGPWQVSGRNDLSEEESQQLDVTYVQNWSVLGDIVYIFRTIGVVLHPKGAY